MSPRTRSANPGVAAATRARKVRARREGPRYPSSLAVERAAQLLLKLADGGFAPIADLSRHLRISGSAVHRILVALRRAGLVEQARDSEMYGLAWGVMRLARGRVGELDVRAAARPFMVALREEHGETVALVARHGPARVCVETVEGEREVRWNADVGRVDPLYAGASGKVLLAFLPEEEQREYFASARLTKLTPKTITDRKALIRELMVVRERGYAISDQDRSVGLGGLAAPVFAPPGVVVAALVIGAPTQRCTDERLKAWRGSVVRAAREISQQLGHREADRSG